MTFPLDSQNNQPLGQEAILRAVAALNGTTPVLVVSTANAGGTLSLGTDAVNNRVSAFSQDGNQFHVSAVQGDGGLFHVSALSPDAGLFRVSALGVTVTTSPLSADSSSISAKQQDASNLRVSALLFDTEYSAAPNVVVSARSASVTSAMKGIVAAVVSPDAAFNHTSSVQGDASLQRVSAILAAGVSSVGAASFAVSAAQLDAGALRVSAILAAGVSSVGAASFGVSAAQSDATALRVSSIQSDAGLQHTSSYSGDANQVHVSAVQGDAGLQHTSSYSGDANQVHVSAVQGDAALQRTSAFNSVATTNTGGASYIFVSSGATSQVSTAKSTAGRLYGYHIGNPAGVDQYLQIFNTSGGATAGTDAPALSLYVPTLGGAVMSLGPGIAFANGIQYIGTSTVNGQTIGASALRINLFYA